MEDSLRLSSRYLTDEEEVEYIRRATERDLIEQSASYQRRRAETGRPYWKPNGQGGYRRVVKRTTGSPIPPDWLGHCPECGRSDCAGDTGKNYGQCPGQYPTATMSCRVCGKVFAAPVPDADSGDWAARERQLVAHMQAFHPREYLELI